MTMLVKKKYKEWLAGPHHAEAFHAAALHAKAYMDQAQHTEAYHAMRLQLAIATALVKARTEVGLTQLDVAERMGISQPAVARIEAGRNVSVNTLARYALALGRSITVKVLPL